MITLAPPDKAVEGAEDTTNWVALVMDVTVVPAEKAPAPPVTITAIPMARPAVLETVIVVDEEVAPAADV